MPLRIQRKRTKGWRMLANTVSVTRPGKWGNPFKVGTLYQNTAMWILMHKDMKSDKRYRLFMRTFYGKERDIWIADIKTSLKWFRKWLKTVLKVYPKKYNLSELKGKNLACFCKLCNEHKAGKPCDIDCPDCDPCHVDIIFNALYKISE